MSELMRADQVETARDAGAAVSRALMGATQEQRRQQLIAATTRIIARHGLSNTTLAKVAQEAGLSPGIVNFYFTSKDQLLLSVLRTLMDEFMSRLEGAIAASGTDPGANLEALIEAMLEPELSSPDKIAVWYAFWGEARARSDYMQTCGDKDEAYYRAMLVLCRQLAEQAPADRPVDAEAVTVALTGLLDQQWQEVLVKGERFDRVAAHRLARGFLASVFPWRFSLPAAPQGIAAAGELIELPRTLPGWTYGNAEFFQVEKERLFRRSWQVVGHVSEVPDTGDYMTFDLLGERTLVIRGKDGVLRAFHNVCRHRAHAVVAGQKGSCQGVIRCPYHGWVYNLDGRLRAMAAERSFPGVIKEEMGLVPLELEIFLGFVFIRLEGGGPSVAERFAPYAEEMKLYRTEEMLPLKQALWTREVEVDWKNVMDNYLEGYHVPAGHPGLFDLFGANYEAEAQPTGIGRATHWIREAPARSWSTRAYQKLLPPVEHLPEERQRAWTYYSLFPSVSFDFYPDQVDFFQVLPLDTGRTLIRAAAYALPDARREMRAARWLNNRINTAVQNEDELLIDEVQRGLGSSVYSVGILSEKETMLRALHDWVRERIPAARLLAPPTPGSMGLLEGALS